MFLHLAFCEYVGLVRSPGGLFDEESYGGQGPTVHLCGRRFSRQVLEFSSFNIQNCSSLEQDLTTLSIGY